MPRLPYGYVPGGRDVTGQRIADPDPYAVAIVRRIFRRLRAGDSPGEIAHALNGDRIPSPQAGGEWRPKEIRRIVANPAYLGRSSPAARPQLVGDAVWNDAQKILRKRSHAATRERTKGKRRAK